MLTHLSIDHGDARTATLRLDAWVPPRRIAVGWRPEQATSPAIQAFVSTARKVTRPCKGRFTRRVRVRQRRSRAGVEPVLVPAVPGAG